MQTLVPGYFLNGHDVTEILARMPFFHNLLLYLPVLHRESQHLVCVIIYHSCIVVNNKVL